MSSHGSKPTPPDHRPYRLQSEPGDETTCYVIDPAGRVFRKVLRQIGWQGQSGAFYALSEDAKPSHHEPGSWAPIHVVAHSDEVSVGDVLDRLLRPEATT